VDRIGPSSCPACKGKECFGGGNLACIQRDPEPSILAGILYCYGNIRFIVTQEKNLVHHLRPDEVAVIVPNLTIHEPLRWSDIPLAIARVELEVDLWLEQRHNDPVAAELATLYKLRKLEQNRRSLNLSKIVET
jgi:hypothetical protein